MTDAKFKRLVGKKLRRRLRSFDKDERPTFVGLARQTGTSEAWIRGVVKGLHNPPFNRLCALVHALGMDIEEFQKDVLEE